MEPALLAFRQTLYAPGGPTEWGGAEIPVPPGPAGPQFHGSDSRKARAPDTSPMPFRPHFALDPTKALVTACVVLLAWRAGSSALGLGVELDPTVLRRAATLTQEERIRAAFGEHYDLCSALVEQVPEDGKILFAADRTDEAATVYSRLQVLLYPRRLFSLDEGAARWDLSAPGFDERVHLVEFGGFDLAALDPSREDSPRVDLLDWFKVVESGPEYRLWRFTGEPR